MPDGICLFCRRSAEYFHFPLQHSEVFLQLFNLMLNLCLVMLEQIGALTERCIALADQLGKLADFLNRHSGLFQTLDDLQQLEILFGNNS